MSRKSEIRGARGSLAGASALIIIATLLAANIARLTIAGAVAETRPQVASRLAPRHPETLISTAMAQVGQAAARAGDPTQDTFTRLRLLAANAPLRPEPFLVEAALAGRDGDYARAEQLLKQARLRDPRSAAARYLLADVWLRQGKVVEGLHEMVVLSRLLPRSSVHLVSTLSQYARTPGARETLTSVLAENPRLKNPVLYALAADPENAALIMALAGPGASSTDRGSHEWQSRLLSGFIKRGEYEQAHILWRQFAGMPRGPLPLLFNGQFNDSTALPPFNWRFMPSRAGFTEPDNGRLRILYFGREDTVVASQLILLPPGTYRFEAPVSGNLVPGSLVWTIRCPTSRSELMHLRLGGSAAPAATFTVKALNCRAQWLELKGLSQDMPQKTDVLVGPARLERVGN